MRKISQFVALNVDIHIPTIYRMYLWLSEGDLNFLILQCLSFVKKNLRLVKEYIFNNIGKSSVH